MYIGDKLAQRKLLPAPSCQRDRQSTDVGSFSQYLFRKSLPRHKENHQIRHANMAADARGLRAMLGCTSIGHEFTEGNQFTSQNRR